MNELAHNVYNALGDMIFDKYIMQGQDTPEKAEMEKALKVFLEKFYEWQGEED